MNIESYCFIWGNNPWPNEEIYIVEITQTHPGIYTVFGGPALCYKINEDAKNELLKIQNDIDCNPFKAKLTTWIINHICSNRYTSSKINKFILGQQRFSQRDMIENIKPYFKNIDIPVITKEVLTEIQNAPRLPIDERINNLLMFIYDSNKEKMGSDKRSLYSFGEIATEAEWNVLCEYLNKNDLIKTQPTTGPHGWLSMTIGVNGLKRLESLNKNKDSKYVFVAMWFHPDMINFYKQAIEPAIKETGYKPVRIDLQQHNNKIDDEIIAHIKKSKFLIADFSHDQEGARGSVYYEAGFAKGLGLPVIFTCRSENEGDLNFDTRQYNHIIYKNPGDLKTQIINRINATIK